MNIPLESWNWYRYPQEREVAVTLGLARIHMSSVYSLLLIKEWSAVERSHDLPSLNTGSIAPRRLWRAARQISDLLTFHSLRKQWRKVTNLGSPDPSFFPISSFTSRVNLVESLPLLKYQVNLTCQWKIFINFSLIVCVCMHVCVKMREWERESERERARNLI